MFIPFAEKESTEQFLSGGGEMGTLIRNMDWSKTALGPISSWPQSLRTSVSLCLSSTFPILIAWGPETIQIYNDSYRPICGAKHPGSMGQNFRICWETALPVVGDKFARGEQGEGTYITDQQMFLDRYGYLEEAFMTFSFAPIRDESGGIGGIFHPITETTEKMLSGRRTQVLRELGAAIGKAKSVQEIATLTQSQYDLYQFDIPFMFFYELKDNTAELLTASGIPAGSVMAPERISLSDSLWPIDDLVAGKEMLEVSGLAQRFGQFSCQPYEEAPHTAIMLPVHISGQAVPFGFIIAGVSARRAPDAAYLNFYSQLAATYNTGISNVYAYEQEQKRAEALAEIDRSKTAFFSNVSHEFRTPLTLMLGPLEELLRQQDMDLHQKLQIEATHRNALRLLKLVNNLLDFSRVEAGRVHAVYQPANLAELTIDLASSFRSIIEKAGMQLHVDCAPLPGNYYADRQMWEKIILNLLSNAFKYTLEGSISVQLTESDKHAVLEVQDTGVGIPEKELPHMFERFHRVENSAGRTHEGSGIGLSLVHELVQLHGGTIHVDSTEGKGSIFTVTIPAGKAHLPTEQVIEDQKTTDSEAIKGAFITEANSLLQDQGNLASADISKTTGDITGHQYRTPDMNTHILIVDDNYDMRNYLERLLNPYFTVDTAVNGKDALTKIRTKVPHLILSDIMMPVMDGKTMLRHIRSDKRLLQLPVIFLSARAGEEARIDGLRAGADDYLVKPFSAAELLTKVRAQINISKTRGFAEQQLRSLLIQAPVAMAIYRGTDYTIEMANERMLTYWGRTEEQVFDKALFDVIPELQTQGFKELMDKVYQTGERYISGELPLVLHRFGVEDTIYLNITIEALRDVDQQINRLIAVAADVTEQVKARKSLEKVNNTFQLAIEASDMGIWQTNVHTGALQISEIARRIHCIPFNTNISYADALKQLVIPQDTERVHQIIETAIQTKGNFNMDYQINPFDGSAPKWINSTGMVEMNEFGEVTSVIGTILDITEGKKDELRKNDFIGMVSHELKTPLTSLTGYSQLGYRKATKEQDTVHASIYEKINTQLRKMSSMINGFLNVSQLESGKIHLKFSSFPLADLITETVSEVGLTASDQEFLIEGCDISLYADRDKIGTVLTNLLSNAVKYGTKGKPVSIKCTAVEQRVMISVTDKGIGINAAHLDKLFDRYYRVENGQTQHISGFGIGLYLSSEIILRHHGRIWAESKMGKGTTFYLELPLTH